ncbi:MAG TPA: hypothetical protein VG965_00700 [Patescibacteria group bacterium]|nr:hypothetical protein [Patescibacteria group bacterium]
MRIRDIKLKEDRNYVILSAACKLRSFGEDEIYFKFEKKYKDFIAIDATPFAAVMLVPAMKRGEDLYIEGSISREFYNGLQKIMKKLVSWNIGLRKIKILPQEITEDNYKSTKVASLFSGGVDSFFTYLKNKEEKNKIDYLILINGYDIRLSSKKQWKLTLQTVRDIAKIEKIEVIQVESNLYELIDPVINWDYACGGCLAAVMLALRKQLKRVYFPSSYRIDQVFPAGAHPEIDELWSTETLKIVHHGKEYSRVDKTKYIGKDKLAQDYLRVCYKNLFGKLNCGKCDKCIRTMIGLKVAGTLHLSKTFPHEVTIEKITHMNKMVEFGAIFQRENLAELEKTGKDKELISALRKSLENVIPLEIAVNEPFSRKVLYFDHVYLFGLTRKLIRVLRS